MKSSLWISACCIALLIGGCAKRQSATRLVYVAPPPAPQGGARAADSGTLVIEEPTVEEEPEADTQVNEAVQPPQPAKSTSPRTRRTGAAQPPPPEPSIEPPPPLEPAKNPGQGGRQQLEKVQHDMGVSIEQFERSPLSEPERQTLAEARAFLDQSTRALKEGDLPRAEKLADKARLLITALEKGR